MARRASKPVVDAGDGGRVALARCARGRAVKGISVNPNTMCPPLRPLEGRLLIEGLREHPDKRTRRHCSITGAGRREYGRLVAELALFLDSVIRSITLIRREICCDGGPRG